MAIQWYVAFSANGQLVIKPGEVPGSISDKLLIGNSDFNGDDYGDWVVKGNAFGKAPVRTKDWKGRGAIGKGLASSFADGKATGTLTSPDFVIQKKYINFLVSGGNWPQELRIKLVINNNEIAFNTGNQFDDMLWISWDVAAWKGSRAKIIIQDNDDGTLNRNVLINPDIKDKVKLPMDYIAVDEIFQSDIKMQNHEEYRPQFHFSPSKNWMNDPNGLMYANGTWHLFAQHNPYLIANGNECWLHATSRDLLHWTEEVEIPMALHGDTMRGMAWTGAGIVDENNLLSLKSDSADKDVLLAFYLRTKQGLSYAYSNDGGKKWFDYPANPVIKWTNESKTLMHNRIDAPKPVRLNDGEWIAPIFDDRIKPVTRSTDAEKGTLKSGTGVTFIVSDNLKKWYQKQKQLLGFNEAECLDAFKLPVYNTAGQLMKDSQWVMNMGYDGYALATLEKGSEKAMQDRKYNFTFSPKKVTVAGSVYCPMTWYNAPDHRRIQITWGNHWDLGNGDVPGIAYPGMPFMSQMTFPIELKIVDYGKYGRQVTRTPVKEIEMLYDAERSTKIAPFELFAGQENKLNEIKGSLFDIALEFEAINKTGEIALEIISGKERFKVSYDAGNNKLALTGFDFLEAKPIGAITLPRPNASDTHATISLRLLIDRSLVEAFAGDGRVYFVRTFFPGQLEKHLELYAKGGRFKISRLEVRQLKSTQD